MKIAHSIFALLFLIAGCASTQDYEEDLMTWVGKSEEDLVSTWGIPDKTYHLSPSKKLLAYTSRNISNTTSPIQCTGTATSPNCKGGSSFTSLLTCETTFTLENSVVLKWTYQGNNCYARH